MGKGSGADIHYYWKKLPIIIETIAPPVQNQWYPLLPATEDIRLLYLVLRQTNDEVAAKNLEVRATWDGIIYNCVPFAFPDNTFRYWRLSGAWDQLISDAVIRHGGHWTDARGLLVSIDMRITDPIGTNQTLRGYIQYEVHVQT
ncbi:MAG: hypothetical protein HWN68_12820 [Desulfobacterales bacterium]|nr:hypothetical protein [Desulfobacterales bacterium]